MVANPVAAVEPVAVLVAGAMTGSCVEVVPSCCAVLTANEAAADVATEAAAEEAAEADERAEQPEMQPLDTRQWPSVLPQ